MRYPWLRRNGWRLLTVFALCSLPFWVRASETDGTIGAGSAYAWGNQIGWINFGTSGGNIHVTDASLTGYAWSANYGWINLAPSGGGVENDGNGNLSGSAWGQNVGYVNFGGVVINPSGKFTGSAASNVGVISFDCAECDVVTDWRPVSVRGGSGGSGGGSGGGGGGGGSGGGSYAPLSFVNTGITISGDAYPGSQVTIMQDGQIVADVTAGPNGMFSATVSGLSGGNYVFSLYAEDDSGLRSSLFAFPVSVAAGSSAQISGVFISPTIDVDKSEVKQGDTIAIFGQSLPNAAISIQVNSDQTVFANATSSSSGAYLYDLNTAQLDFGAHSVKSKAAVDNLISNDSVAQAFTVGTQDVAAPKPTQQSTCLRGDLNCDGRVNLVDFSIMAYWYKKPNPPAAYLLDGKSTIDLTDFSIMAYYWTG
jgi:hypothetical protein